MPVGIELTLYSSCITGKRGMCLVLIIVVHIECRTRLLNDLGFFFLNNRERVLVVKLIRGSNEASLLSDELVEILGLICIVPMPSTKSRHPGVEGVHRPRHAAGEPRTPRPR